MHHKTSSLVIYRNPDPDGILPVLADVFRQFESGSFIPDEMIGTIYDQTHRLLDLATRFGFNEDLWQCYLAWLLAVTENPFSLACEKTGAREGSVNLLAKRDFKIFKSLFDYDFRPIEQALGIDCFSVLRQYKAIEKDKRTYNRNVSEKVLALRTAIGQAADENDVFHIVTEYYRNHGVGMFGLNKAFRLKDAEGPLTIEPITNTVEVRLKDLIGYESQKQRLVENTEAFLLGARANNLLLYGDSGTGKSTCVKAILNEYQDRGLRIIEIYKHQFKDLSAVISRIKNRNYRFILLMDDLSFEDFEIEYKYLKAVIEGGMEVTPDNVLLYATSNRRHLIRETWTDRKDAFNENDVHHSDTVEEKISLVNRFGVSIGFFKPSQQEYLDIVKGIAARYPEIILPEEVLTSKAFQWSMQHGGFSGRRAQQFINHLLGQSAGN